MIATARAIAAARSRRLAVFLTIATIMSTLAATAVASDPWWDASWGERKFFRFRNADQSETLTDVPILVLLDSTRIDYAKTQNAGEDLRFIDADGSTVLDHEIEKWDETGVSAVWVRVPQVDGASTSDGLWMYYDNPGASDGQDAAGVWSDGFVGVWHLGEDPTSPAITFDNVTTDASSASRSSASFSHTVGGGSNRALVVVVMTRGDQGATAVTYDGDPLTLAVSEDAGGGSSEWVSVWYMVAPATGSNTVSVTFGANADPSAVAALSYFGVDQTNPIDATASASSSFSTTTVSVDITTTRANAMVVGGLGHHGGDTDPHSPGGDVTSERFDFATGTDYGSDSGHAGGEIATTTAGTYTFRWTNGVSDDYAIACVALRPHSPIADSSVWPTADWWNASWSDRAVLRFQNAAQSEDLIDFPVLVRLDSTRIDYAKVQDSGQDLRFIDGDGTTLEYDIEEWDESGSSWVWVNVPRIDGSSNEDYIWMYYGNSGASAGEDPASVWTDYDGVWHLNDDFASATGSNNGTNAGSSDVAGPIADGQSFDGSGDYVYTAKWFSQPQLFTVSAWFRTSSASGTRFVGYEQQRTGTSSTTWDRHLYVGFDGRLRFGCYAGQTDIVTSSGTVTDNVWHWAVGVRDDASNTLLLYLDGQLQGSVSNAEAEPVSGYWRIGSYKTGSWDNGVDGYFPGQIDEVRVAAASRSSDWVAAQYLSMTDGFIVFGGTSHDATTRGSMGAGDVVAAKIADGLALDGVDDRVVVSDSTAFDAGTGAFTISVWFRKVNEDRCDVFNWKNAAGDDDFGLILQSDETADFYLSVDGASTFLPGAPAFTIGEWHQLTATRAASGGGIKVYVDGSEIASGTSAADIDQIDAGTELWFGSNRSGVDTPTFPIDGDLDELRIATEARSADWVTVQYLSMTDQFLSTGVRIVSWQEVAP